jgi:hypothetical protein
MKMIRSGLWGRGFWIDAKGEMNVTEGWCNKSFRVN